MHSSIPADRHRQMLQLSMCCYFKGTSSGEMLIPHPQLLAQHIPSDKSYKKKKGQGKAKQKKLFYKLIYFSRETCSELYTGPHSWDELCCNRGIARQLTQGKMLGHCSPVWNGTWEQREHAHYCACHLTSILHLGEGKHTWLGEGKNGLSKLWPST